ncbi:Gamma-glutamyl cyclotransferase, AIG2-like [Marinospirillum celere]|uniref:Gamma-glutamyl cyclotransferase, AIG2-like n=1 Tax=Marinospirillum celere TaxID=1122252 RepID=A0A1I1JI65_9GAMM|nr:gamma-glutamylcyclotransferase family protein [Marinospirillum celere]SFC48309.1 Gamma-glutamyl cyclotransferase, AIG2-like [Marinospirillum celere]
MRKGKYRLSRTQTLISLFAILPLLLASYWWLIWQSPWLFQPPADFYLEEVTETQKVFAYGTLKSPWVRMVVTRRISAGEPARLAGFEREALNLVEADLDTYVEGIVFEATPAELNRLDRYERIGIRYERRLHQLDNGQEAWVYHLLGLGGDTNQ